MAGGLAALLDDIAALAKLAAASVDDVGAAAAKASAKAAGVVIDDTAVTPRYLEGFAAERELPVVGQIAAGSIRNKLFLILPAILLMSQFVPWLLTPLLMVGGVYLCYEGAEKLWEHFAHHDVPAMPVVMGSPDSERAMVRGAIRTDLILSAEIMVIALNEVTGEPFLTRTVVLVAVAFLITAVVYGVVAFIVKMDDIGLRLARRESEGSRRTGRFLVRAMPGVLGALSRIGMIAMLWVGGHIILNGVDELGWSAPYDLLKHLTESVRGATGPLGGILGWFTDTIVSAAVGLLVGAIAVSALTVVHRARAAGTADVGRP